MIWRVLCISITQHNNAPKWRLNIREENDKRAKSLGLCKGNPRVDIQWNGLHNLNPFKKIDKILKLIKKYYLADLCH